MFWYKARPSFTIGSKSLGYSLMGIIGGENSSRTETSKAIIKHYSVL